MPKKADARTVKQKHTVLQANQRLSQSILWQLQRKFFSLQGEKAWSKGIVPHYITSNPYIVHAYTQVIFGWLRDVASSLDRSQPIYMVELGTGSGRFSYHFLNMFFEFFDQSVLRDIPIMYVMTDFAKTTLDFWKNQTQLERWIEAGRLDFARFDAEVDTTLTLINQGITLTSDTLKNPMCFIANYFFDGLTQDVFRIKNSVLYESLVTLTVPQPNPNLNDPYMLEQIDMSFKHQSLTSPYYEDDDFNRLLQAYESSLSQTTLLFPIGSLECMRRLLQLTNSNMFLLTGDKGYHLEADLLLRGEPMLSKHGSFSMMVNYHALGQYTHLQNGQFLSTPHHHDSLDICAMLFGQHPHNYPETRQAYQREIIQANPDDFYMLKKAIDQQDEAFEVEQFLAFLRLSQWDSTIFLEYFPLLLQTLDDLPDKTISELYRAAEQIWTLYYHLGEEQDLAFALGRLFYGLDYYEEAIGYFQYSLDLYGDLATTLCHLAMCYYELDQLDSALAFVNRSLAIDPQFELAQELRIKIDDEW